MRKRKLIIEGMCILILILALALIIISLNSCEMDLSAATDTRTDVQKTQDIAKNLESNQPTPTDISYSLERYNLIRRAYWVNGMREKARTLPCEIADIPLGYVTLYLEGVGEVAKHIVEGKVTSLNSFLTPDSAYYEYSAGDYTAKNPWLADVDGSYGENDTGIFFFTPDGKYIEWTGTYLYSDIPFESETPKLHIAGDK